MSERQTECAGDYSQPMKKLVLEGAAATGQILVTSNGMFLFTRVSLVAIADKEILSLSEASLDFR